MSITNTNDGYLATGSNDQVHEAQFTADVALREAIGPADDLIPITSFGDYQLYDASRSGVSTGFLAWPFTAGYVARAFVCSCDGVATVVTEGGNTRTGIPLVKGWNPGPRVSRVKAWTPSVAEGTIWGVPA